MGDIEHSLKLVTKVVTRNYFASCFCQVTTVTSQLSYCQHRAKEVAECWTATNEAPEKFQNTAQKQKQLLHGIKINECVIQKKYFVKSRRVQ